MLKLIHLLNGVVVVSDLGERERLIIELLGGDSVLWVDSFLAKLFLDVHGVVPGLHLEVSGELTELVVHLVFGDLKWLWALVELHKLKKLLLIVGDIHGGSRSNSSAKNKSGEFHSLTENIYILFITFIH